jgi:hypothetical protein
LTKGEEPVQVQVATLLLEVTRLLALEVLEAFRAALEDLGPTSISRIYSRVLPVVDEEPVEALEILSMVKRF